MRDQFTSINYCCSFVIISAIHGTRQSLAGDGSSRTFSDEGVPP